MAKSINGNMTWQYSFSPTAFNAVANNGYILGANPTVTLPKVSLGKVGDIITIIWNNNTGSLVQPFSGDVIYMFNNAAFTSIQVNTASANFQFITFINATSGNWACINFSGTAANWTLV